MKKMLFWDMLASNIGADRRSSEVEMLLLQCKEVFWMETEVCGEDVFDGFQAINEGFEVQFLNGVISDIYFYGSEGDNPLFPSMVYVGELPFGLMRSDSSEVVRRKLSNNAAFHTYNGSYGESFKVCGPKYDVSLDFADDRSRLRMIAISSP